MARRRASCRSRRVHFREDPEYWAQVVPGRLHHRELPRPVPQLVLLDAGDGHGPPPRAAVQDDLRLRRSSSARTAGRCTRARATRSTSTRPPSGWASTSCAGCSRPPGRRRTSGSAGTRPTTRGASCSSSGTPTGSSSASPRWPAGRRIEVGRRPRSGRRWIAGSCRGRPGWPRRREPAWPTTTPSGRRAGSRPSSRTSRPGMSAFRGSGSRRQRGQRRTADAAFATLHEALVTVGQGHRPAPAVPRGIVLRQPRGQRRHRTRPTPST